MSLALLLLCWTGLLKRETRRRACWIISSLLSARAVSPNSSHCAKQGLWASGAGDSNPVGFLKYSDFTILPGVIMLRTQHSVSQCTSEDPLCLGAHLWVHGITVQSLALLCALGWGSVAWEEGTLSFPVSASAFSTYFGCWLWIHVVARCISIQGSRKSTLWVFSLWI